MLCSLIKMATPQPCVICGDSSLSPTSLAPNKKGQWKNHVATFIREQMGIGGELSLCGDCQWGVSAAMDWREQISSLEQVIQKMQQQLRQLTDNYGREMSGLGDKIKAKEQRSKVTPGTSSSAGNGHHFRTGIINVENLTPASDETGDPLYPEVLVKVEEQPHFLLEEPHDLQFNFLPPAVPLHPCSRPRTTPAEAARKLRQLTSTRGRPFKCDQCPRTFKQENGLKTHLARIHGRKFTTRFAKKPGYKGKVCQQRCPNCNEHIGLLKKPWRYRHIKTCGVTFSCDLCDKSFKSKKSMERHKVKLHAVSQDPLAVPHPHHYEFNIPDVTQSNFVFE